MKPKKLTMSGFCPYSEEVEIDFDIFDGSGLFLIAGETGAGKTTIFDGISFALFGEVSGENRGNDMLRSDFAKPETQTFVKLVFEDKGEVYEIERNPKYNRPVKRGDSGRMTVQNADAKILLPNKKVITGVKEVTEKVTDLLGINHQQFKQIAMIAQGEFLKLLFASSEDRGKIFRKVFGTELYERIQKDLKYQTIGFKNKMEDIDKAILQYNDGIICEEETEDTETYLNLKDSVHGLSDMVLLLERLVEKSISEKEQKLDESGKIQTQIDALGESVTKGEQINGLFGDLEKETQKSKELDNQFDTSEELKKKLEMGKFAAYQVKPKYEDFIRLEKQRQVLEDSINKNGRVIEDNTPKQEAGRKELDEQNKQEPQREALATEIQKIKETIPEYEKLAITDSKLKEIVEKGELLESEGEKLSDLLKIQKIRVETIQNELKSLKEIEIMKMGLEQKEEKLLEEKNKLGDLEESANSCITINKEYKLKQKDCKKKEEDYNTIKLNYDELERLFYREQAGIMAETLEEEMPCPVCGSLNHPHKAQKSTEAPSQKKLNQEKKDQEKLRTAWQKSSTNCQLLKTKFNTKFDQLKIDMIKLKFASPSSVNELLELIIDREKELTEIIGKVEQDLINAEASCIKKVNLEKEMGNLETQNGLDEVEITKKNETLSKIEVLFASLTTEVTGLKEKLKFGNKELAEAMIKQKQENLKKMKDALTDAKNILQSVTVLINEAMTLKNAEIEQFKNTEKELGVATQEFEEQLIQCGFDSLIAYKAANLLEDKIKEIEDNLKKYNDDVAETKTKILQLKKQISGREKMDIPALENDKKELIGKQKDSRREQENIEHIIKNNQGILRALKLKVKEREEIESVYGEIKRLSETANGELSGKQKLAFEQYVQGVYFDMILAEANKRFGSMSDNRYSLVRKNEGTNKQKKSGLEIDVEDKWTLKTRSVKSLSGGESFKASLSLALGLSDIVQNFSGGIQMDTMFIDEGFGSLDSESLDKAMDILAGLTEGDRLVGIISHLDELKEKIDKKIIITRDPQGSKIFVQA